VRWHDASDDSVRRDTSGDTDDDEDDDDDDDKNASSSSTGDESDADTSERDAPGAIDNSALVVDASVDWSPLRDSVCEDVDFELVPESVWFFFASWYTAAPVVCREAIAVGPKQLASVELRPLTLVGVPFALDTLLRLIEKLKLVALFSSASQRVMAAALDHFNAPPTADLLTVRVSKTCTIGDLAARFAALLKKNKLLVRLHMPPADSDAQLRVNAGAGAATAHSASAVKELTLLDDPYASVQSVLLQNGGRLLVEISTGDDVWPLSPPETPSRLSAMKRGFMRMLKGVAKLGEVPDDDRAREDATDDVAPRLQGGDAGSVGGADPAAAAGDGAERTTSRAKPSGDGKKAAKKGASSEVDGMCGLKNLGNTCYMNSAVQALSLTTEFRRYFLSERFKADLNKDNPLGTKGKVAEAFAALLAKMWAGEFQSVSPAQLRGAVGKAESRFDSYQQQDSQELMAFLLDALHEDLNRVRDKPYVEKKEAAGRPDSVVAAEAWTDHTRRNKSTVVDLFQGQLRSELTCPQCSQRSVTFDPFMFLSLPLPIDGKCMIELIFVRYMALGHQTKYAVQIPKRCKMEDVRAEISAVVGVDKAHLIIGTFSRLLIGAWLIDGRDNDDVVNSNGPVLVFETPDRRAQNLLRVQVYHRARETLRGYVRDYKDDKVFGVPFVLYFPKEGTTALELYELALKHCERYLRVNTESDDSDESSAPPDDDDQDDDDDDDEKERASAKSAAKKSAANDTSDAPASAPKSLDAKGDDAPATPDVTDETAGYDSARSEAGASVRFPFVLKFVGKDGKTCSQCTRVTCAGCVLEPDDTVLPFEKPGAFLAADWKLRDLRRLYRRSSISSVTLDATVAKAREGPKHPQISLATCFDTFSAVERLSAHDEWYCSKCAEHVRATKMLTLWKLPPLLIVHLKRFSYGASLVSRQKLQHMVECPADGLDLAPFVLGGDGAAGTYRLYAVINHVGGIGGGHYFAYGRGCDPANPDQWYELNDSSVTPHRGAPVTNAAYILLYERVAVAPGTLVLDRAPPSTAAAGAATAASAAPASGKKIKKKRKEQ
jgi:ubiquitin C-terminal hydrolase